MGNNSEKSTRVWVAVLNVFKAAIIVGAIVFAFSMMESCAKEDAERAEAAEKAKMDAIIQELEESGNIEGYGNYEDGIYVRIPYEDIKTIEAFIDGDTGYEYGINECFDLLWDYYEDHEDEMSDFEQDVFEDAIDIGFDMRKVIESIYEEIPIWY